MLVALLHGNILVSLFIVVMFSLWVFCNSQKDWLGSGLLNDIQLNSTCS